MLSIDLNCDMGESFGPWRMRNDAALMRHISSANIACGFHAGDATTMHRTVDLAIEHNVAVGAHPGYPDLQGFGRRALSMQPSEIFDIILYQVSALKGICEAVGTRLNHVKPHGALYNKAAKDGEIARAIAEAVLQIDASLILYGLSGSLSICEAEKAGLRTASEVFADRTYQPDGSLTPRSEPNALIRDLETASAQAVQMARARTVTATDGTTVPVTADTICVHGDTENALEMAAAIRRRFAEENITVRPVGKHSIEEPERRDRT